MLQSQSGSAKLPAFLQPLAEAEISELLARLQRFPAFPLLFD